MLGKADSQLETLATRVLNLEVRVLDSEKRLARGDNRYDLQSKHLRNLEARVSGQGSIERDPHIQER